MHVYHVKHGRRVKPKSKDKTFAVENSPSSSCGKRKRATPVKTSEEGVRSTIVDEQRVRKSDAIDASNSENYLKSLQEDQTPIPMHEDNQKEIAEVRDLTDDEGQCSSIINRYASSKTTSTPCQRFSWTDEDDR